MNNIMPPVTKNLLIINLLFFFATIVGELRGIDLADYLGLHFFLASDFRLWQLITYMFMHGGFWHIFLNMFALWMFGSVVEAYWGQRKFLLYYLVCGIGAGLVQEGVQYLTYVHQGLAEFERVRVGYASIPMEQYLNYWNTVGASGAVYGILLAYGLTFPNNRVFIFPFPFPVKALYLIIIYACIELVGGLSNNAADNVAHFAHLGGMLFGLALIRLWRHNNTGYGENLWSKTQRNLTNLKKRLFKRREKKNFYTGERREDYEYNARKRAEEEEINRILEKVRKSGYQSLTEEEKRKLFDASRH